MPVAIELVDISKRFRLQGGHSQPTTLKSAVVDFFLRRAASPERFAVLQDIDLLVEQGRTLGIIGRNGSGKSTLLKLIAGIYRPDAGRVVTHGRIAALIELGAGFHPELSGRENIIINAMMLGLSRREVLARVDKIIDFADLGGFIDEPTRVYSSGMYMRLGFSVAIHVDPDILLIDEVLAIGDESFAKKCTDRISEFRRRGKTIVLVTHDTGLVQRWCDDVIWLDGGIVRASGSPKKVIDLYHQAIAEQESDVLAQSYRTTEAEAGQRWGNRQVEIVRVRLTDRDGQERYVYESGESMTATFAYRVAKPVSESVFSFAILRADGLWIYSTNTALRQVIVPALGATGEVTLTVERLDLLVGSYFFDVAVHAPDGAPYDYHSRLYGFTIRSDSGEIGVAPLPHRWRFQPADEGSVD